ncbi:MAG: ACP phosphodiesterase [Bacteroidota bacterium]
MNFLAHLALSWSEPDLQVGNFLGDYTKGRTPDHYPPGVKQGIQLHRLIDATTDAHPAIKNLTARLKPRHGRYAGVISDVILDLYLYRHWEELALPAFPLFARNTYDNLLANTYYLTPDLGARIQNMVREEWLTTYTTTAGILNVFHRMQHRISRPKLMQGIATTMSDEDAAFDQAFLFLFPDLQTTVNQFCGDQ